MPSKFLFTRNQIVNSVMAVPASGHRFTHLRASEPFLKPLILMASFWNQVVLSGSVLQNSKAKHTLTGLQFRRSDRWFR